MNVISNIMYFISYYWIPISMILILFGGISGGILIFLQASQMLAKQHEIDSRFYDNPAFNAKGKTEDYFKDSWYRVLALDLNALVILTPIMTRLLIYVLLSISVILGIGTGIWVEQNYFNSGRNPLPFGQLSYIVPIIIGLGVMTIPFLLLRAVVQRRRAKLSHQFLGYVEEFERKYLQKFDVYPALIDLTDVLQTGTFKSMTFRVVQAMQRKQESKLHFELEVFEHQIGSIFATTFFIMFRESYGLVQNSSGRRESKKISEGLRSLIEQMHGYLRVSHEDKPKKREIVQVGFFAFPLLYGAHYFGIKMMGAAGAKKFMFDSPLGSTMFVGGIFFGFMAIVVNLIISRRKFDL
ncbi:hypothetical protein [Paenibacillus sp. GP183]|uniref:hypothetical protein n=1 Tax=Paenibacillus sp. GP183 TaxID=1882751 RepID=UPI00089846D7|nr:hypothetical protein [Paenibacillus sp. GP183]SED12749.1 hypothetical protein SAMN05443246_5826 [Paenibacillus sp. GP183]